MVSIVVDAGVSSDPSLLILLTTRWLHRFCVLQTTAMGQHLSQFTSEKVSTRVNDSLWLLTCSFVYSSCSFSLQW